MWIWKTVSEMKPENLKNQTLQSDDPLCLKVAHAQDKLWSVVNGGTPVPCILLFLLGRSVALVLEPIHMWYQNKYRINPIKSILFNKDPHQVINSFTRSLPPAEKTLYVDTQCLTKHVLCSLSLSLEIYMVSLFYVTSYLHSSWKNEIIFNSFQHQLVEIGCLDPLLIGGHLHTHTEIMVI